MIYTELTKKAMQISFDAHKEQKDKGNAPYVYHPFHLAESMKDEISASVALLHDVVEDTDITLEYLKEAGFPTEVVEAVDCLTRRKGEDYGDFIERVSKNPVATKVKIADLKHNSDLSRLDFADEQAKERAKKYGKYLKILKKTV